jgi:hypothetical protein
MFSPCSAKRRTLGKDLLVKAKSKKQSIEISEYLEP